MGVNAPRNRSPGFCQFGGGEVFELLVVLSEFFLKVGRSTHGGRLNKSLHLPGRLDNNSHKSLD